MLHCSFLSVELQQHPLDEREFQFVPRLVLQTAIDECQIQDLLYFLHCTNFVCSVTGNWNGILFVKRQVKIVVENDNFTLCSLVS